MEKEKFKTVQHKLSRLIGQALPMLEELEDRDMLVLSVVGFKMGENDSVDLWMGTGMDSNESNDLIYHACKMFAESYGEEHKERLQKEGKL